MEHPVNHQKLPHSSYPLPFTLVCLSPHSSYPLPFTLVCVSHLIALTLYLFICVCLSLTSYLIPFTFNQACPWNSSYLFNLKF